MSVPDTKLFNLERELLYCLFKITKYFMSESIPGVKKITPVPQNILDILNSEVNSWNYIDNDYHYDIVFSKHKVKVYFGTPVVKEIKIPDNIKDVVNWIESVMGPNQKIVRCFLNLMEPKQHFNLHVDTLKLHVFAKRLHIPIKTNNQCFFYTYKKNNTGWDEFISIMEYGYLYQLDNFNPHNVKNNLDYRIHLICDLIDQNLIDNSLNNSDVSQVEKLHSIFRYGLKINHL